MVKRKIVKRSRAPVRSPLKKRSRASVRSPAKNRLKGDLRPTGARKSISKRPTGTKLSKLTKEGIMRVYYPSVTPAKRKKMISNHANKIVQAHKKHRTFIKNLVERSAEAASIVAGGVALASGIGEIAGAAALGTAGAVEAVNDAILGVSGAAATYEDLSAPVALQGVEHEINFIPQGMEMEAAGAEDTTMTGVNRMPKKGAGRRRVSDRELKSLFDRPFESRPSRLRVRKGADV